MTNDLLLMDQAYCSQGDTAGTHSPKKIFVESNRCYLIDEDGTQYLDMQMQNSAANFGYRNRVITESAIKQLNILPSLAAEFMNDNRILLAAKICSYMEREHGVKGRVHFSVGGAQANDDALKLIANHTGTKNVFTFEGCYHGRNMAASSISSSYRYKRQFGSVIDTYRIPFPYCYRCPYNKSSSDCQLFCLDIFEEKFESELYGIYDDRANVCAYAAIIAEPVLGRGGYIVPPNGYFKRLKGILDRHHILWVSDEIQMGLYRTGRLWGFENYDIVPDAFTFGKSISNGIWPLSGVWAKEALISPDVWPVGSTHATFLGHPLGTRLGLDVMNYIETTSFLTEEQESRQNLLRIIQSLSKDYKIIGNVQVLGHAANIELVRRHSKQPAPDLAKAIVDMALTKPLSIDGEKYGLILTIGGFFGNVITLSPYLQLSIEDWNLFSRLIRHFLNQVEILAE